MFILLSSIFSFILSFRCTSSLYWVCFRWSKLFKSRLVSALGQHAHIYSYTGAFVLFILFAGKLTIHSYYSVDPSISHAVREVNKYSHVDAALESSIRHTADADAVIHMRLFRAQRNFYISGFALLLFLSVPCKGVMIYIYIYIYNYLIM
uniref:Endoplasmic reticulum transmembrane protein n=1 Tax=Heterorhabditis bacteriophora TaxID=37862 RepID=A0A1I7XJM2_HETBA